MTGVFKRLLPGALLPIAILWLVLTITRTGDWGSDSWPAVHALAQGDIAGYLSAKAMMGPFATLVQAPFAAISAAGPMDAYRWAVLPCLLAAGILGLYLADIAARRGASRVAQLLIAALCLLNPLTLQALNSGHPEEVLTAALTVAAVASAAEGHGRRTAVLLGLAIASKQWAVIAILPVLLALPGRRIRVGVAAAVVAVALTLPSVIAAPGVFSETNHSAASAGRVVTPWSVWYPLATVRTESVGKGPGQLTLQVHEVPSPIGSLSHPLILLLAVLLPVALALRRGRTSLSGADAMALLALLALLRCALDPVDNLYYHAPLLLALLGWDALDSRGLPLRGLSAAAFALLFWHWSRNLSDIQAFNTAYLVMIVTAGLAVALALFKPGGWTRVRSGQTSRRRILADCLSSRATLGPEPDFRRIKPKFRGSSVPGRGR
jgi:hypothetical protein